MGWIGREERGKGQGEQQPMQWKSGDKLFCAEKGDHLSLSDDGLRD